MERRLMEAAARAEAALDPELLFLFRAARSSTSARGDAPSGRDRAYTVGRSDPSKARPRLKSSSFEDLHALGVSLGTEDIPDFSPTLERDARRVDPTVRDAFIAAVRESADSASHANIAALATLCAARPTALAISSPRIGDIFAPIPEAAPASD
jgi:hypothetical protein